MSFENVNKNYRNARHNQIYEEYKKLVEEMKEKHGDIANEVTKKWFFNTLSERLDGGYSPQTIRSIVYNKEKEEREGKL